MGDSLKPYGKYRGAGTLWFEKVPSHWSYEKLGMRFNERRTKVSDRDFAPLSVTKNGIVPQLTSAAKTNDGDNRKLVKVGDFVINSRSDRKGSSGLSIYDGSVSLINIVLKPIGISSKYSHYLFKNYSFIEEFYRNGRGIVADLWTTRYCDMRNINIPLPPKDEQDQIAIYLDWKLSKINKFIRLKKRQIELLKEQKQAIINQAVTKGLDPNVEMKPSGIEWLGDIPEGWAVKRLKSIVDNISIITMEKGIGDIYLGLENVEAWSGKIINTSTNTTFDSQAKRFKEDNILFGKLRPYLAKVAIPSIKGVCSGEFLVLDATCPGILNVFVKYLLSSKSIIELISMSTYGAKMPRAEWNFIGNIKIGIPPLKEQHSIVAYIDSKLVATDNIIHRIEKEIALITEYRTSLIADVVTGKVDVRHIKVDDGGLDIEARFEVIEGEELEEELEMGEEAYGN